MSNIASTVARTRRNDSSSYGRDISGLAAAERLNWLIMSAPINRAMLLERDERPASAELKRHADGKGRAFIGAYREMPPA